MIAIAINIYNFTLCMRLSYSVRNAHFSCSFFHEISFIYIFSTPLFFILHA